MGYFCKKCGKQFNQKGSYSKHINNKLSCIDERESKKNIGMNVDQKIDLIIPEELDTPHTGIIPMPTNRANRKLTRVKKNVSAGEMKRVNRNLTGVKMNDPVDELKKPDEVKIPILLDDTIRIKKTAVPKKRVNRKLAGVKMNDHMDEVMENKKPAVPKKRVNRNLTGVKMNDHIDEVMENKKPAVSKKRVNRKLTGVKMNDQSDDHQIPIILDDIKHIKKAVMPTKHNLGQYFTTNEELKEKVFDFILNRPSNILEPSIGQGDLITFITDRIPGITFDMYEIDQRIKLLEGIDLDKIIYGDFMKQQITKKYKTIVGNPPYVRTKKGNLYIDFIEKCYNLLDDMGEMIFIVPSDFLKLTCASKLLNIMMTNGTITHIYHPHNEKLFENAAIDVIVFRYCRDKSIEKKVLYNERLLYLTNSNGLITFGNETNDDGVLIKDLFDIYVGLVSGKEEVYKNKELGNIDVLNGENKVDRYIYIESFPCENKEINKYLLQYQEQLITRGIRKFNLNNWFEWGAPRNMSAINTNLGKECIYIYNLTRKTNVAFLGRVNYFGGGLIMLIPKKKCNLAVVVEYINSNMFKDNFMFSGRFKIGHRQICNSYIPSELKL